jgi:hypothetical protein
MLLSQVGLWALVLHLYRSQRRIQRADADNALDSEEPFFSEEVDPGAHAVPLALTPQSPVASGPGEALQDLAAQLERVAQRLDDEVSAKAQAVRHLLEELEQRAPGVPHDEGREQLYWLAQTGLSIPEIARRSGRAREEVDLLVRLAGQPERRAL